MPEPEEDGASFWENARIKALAYAEATGVTAYGVRNSAYLANLGERLGTLGALYSINGILTHLLPPELTERYLSRISGPLLDRIDIHIEVPQVKFREMTSAKPGEPSSAIRERVVAARQRQQARFAGKKITCNARMGTRELKEFCLLDEAATELLRHAMTEMGLSARAHDRILKVSRTIADLAGADEITPAHLSEAIQYRSLDRQFWNA